MSSNVAFHHVGKLASPLMFRKARVRGIRVTYSWKPRTKANAAKIVAVTTPRTTTVRTVVGDHVRRRCGRRVFARGPVMPSTLGSLLKATMKAR